MSSRAYYRSIDHVVNELSSAWVNAMHASFSSCIAPRVVPVCVRLGQAKIHA